MPARRRRKEKRKKGRRTGEPLCELLDGRALLLLADLLVLLLVGRRLESLPGQAPAQEVHEDVSERLEVVAPRLLAPEVRVDAHVARRARQALALAVRDVLLRLGVAVLLGHAKVDDVDRVGVLRPRPADEEVVGLDVAVDQVLLVDRLHARELCRGTAARRKRATKRVVNKWPPPLARVGGQRTICLAVMHTVLVENLRPHMSNRSSRLGPRRSITSTLCRPSWPK